MKLHSPLSTLLLALAALASPAALAAGAVKVNFVQPEKFADIGYGSLDRERTLRALGVKRVSPARSMFVISTSSVCPSARRGPPSAMATRPS